MKVLALSPALLLPSVCCLHEAPTLRDPETAETRASASLTAAGAKVVAFFRSDAELGGRTVQVWHVALFVLLYNCPPRASVAWFYFLTNAEGLPAEFMALMQTAAFLAGGDPKIR
jgi:hypothetical protein